MDDDYKRRWGRPTTIEHLEVYERLKRRLMSACVDEIKPWDWEKAKAALHHIISDVDYYLAHPLSNPDDHDE